VANSLAEKMIKDNPNLLVETYFDMDIDADSVTYLTDIEKCETATNDMKAMAI
jgi:hypothetical protein